jgi:hypothetical protein
MPAQAAERSPQRAAHGEGEKDLQRVANGHRRSLAPMATDFTLLPDIVLPDVVPPDVAAWQHLGSLQFAPGDLTL